MFNSIFSDNELINYINGNLSDSWIGTPFEGYVFLSPKRPVYYKSRIKG
jgi:hypothetical protein